VLKVIVLTVHATLKHLLAKNNTKLRLIRRILLLLESDVEIKDRKGSENSVSDHLSRIFTKYTKDLVEFSNRSLDEQLFAVSHTPLPWFAHIMNYLATKQEKVKFFSQVRHYYWEDRYLFKHCPNQVVRRCVSPRVKFIVF